MKRTILFISIMCSGLCLNLHAQNKNLYIQCGELESALENRYDYTTLTITGSMDARDFACIQENLRNLTSIDLSGCFISGYDSRDEKYLGNHSHFEDNSIPPSAFFGMTELTKVLLPQTTIRISEGSFAGCEKLTTITGITAIEEIGDYAFCGCTQLETFPFPATLKKIGNYSFDKCSALQETDFSGCSKLSTIGSQAFSQNTNLKRISFSDNILQIGDGAFAGCSALQTIQLPTALSSCGIAVFAQCTTLSSADLSQTHLATLPAWTFSGCTGLTSISLPSTLTAIEEGAFHYCSSLPSISLPAATDYLAAFAFAGCSALKVLNFMPEGMEYIARFCFYNNLTADSVTIPSTVSYIGSHAFDGCENANTFTTFRNMPAELGELVFANMNVEQKTLQVPTESIAIYENTPQWQDFGNTNGLSASDNTISPQTLKVAFIQYDLHIKSSQEMTDIRMYDTSGILLTHILPGQTEAVIRTNGFSSNIFLLQITTADGKQTIVKTARAIR